MKNKNGKEDQNLSQNANSPKEISKEEFLYEIFGIKSQVTGQHKGNLIKEVIELSSSNLGIKFEFPNRVEQMTLVEKLIELKGNHFPPFVKKFLVGYKHLDSDIFFKIITALESVLMNCCKKLNKPMGDLKKEDLHNIEFYFNVTKNTAVMFYLNKFYSKITPFCKKKNLLNRNGKKESFSHETVNECEKFLVKNGWMESSIKSFRSIIKVFFSWVCSVYKDFDQYTINTIPVWKITIDCLKDYRSYLIGLINKGELSRLTANKKIIDLRHFFSVSVHLGYSLLNMKKISNIQADSYVYRDIPSSNELQKFFNTVIEFSDNQRKDILMYQFMLYLGLRIDEVLRLKWDDINEETKTLVFKGKGEEYHRLPLPSLILSTINELPIKIKKGLVFEKPYFTNQKVSGRHRVFCLLAGTMHFNGLHIFRHTFITKLSEMQKCNPNTLRLLARHKSLNTTSKYLHRSDESLINSVNKIKY
ncbi:tyrosine-type recombinase/integrase [Cytobacillus sp. SAFR-174]|uniref:tyrosine-type recombinase/integrase n=1 Tax=Cytobacillus sp. SAFR-174 TaxID=3436868 RepID=UPI003F8228CE